MIKVDFHLRLLGEKSVFLYLLVLIVRERTTKLCVWHSHLASEGPPHSLRTLGLQQHQQRNASRALTGVLPRVDTLA
jgi:hypothetical protein